MANVPSRVIELVKTFDRNIEAYKNQRHNEAQLRRYAWSAKLPAEKTRIQRQITTTDNQIDKLTYDLYGLTQQEIKIIEEANDETV